MEVGEKADAEWIVGVEAFDGNQVTSNLSGTLAEADAAEVHGHCGRVETIGTTCAYI